MKCAELVWTNVSRVNSDLIALRGFGWRGNCKTCDKERSTFNSRKRQFAAAARGSGCSVGANLSRSHLQEMSLMQRRLNILEQWKRTPERTENSRKLSCEIGFLEERKWKHETKVVFFFHLSSVFPEQSSPNAHQGNLLTTAPFTKQNERLCNISKYFQKHPRTVA